MKIIRSNRKSIAIEVNRNLELFVRVPYAASEKQILEFVNRKAGWIDKSMKKMQQRIQESENQQQEKLTVTEIQKLAEEALEKIPKRVEYYAHLMGVTYGRITIRNQKTRWGSCSSKGNLNFNCLLMLAPKDVIDYVVVHELCHRKEMNHSKQFWAEVEQVLPDYKISRTWLKEHGHQLINRAVSE